MHQHNLIHPSATVQIKTLKNVKVEQKTIKQIKVKVTSNYLFWQQDY